MRSVLSASLLLTLALALSRLSGFARETMMAARYGITERGDAAILLVSLPDLLVGFFLVGGFNAAVVPALKVMPHPEKAAFVRVLATYCVIVFSALALLIFWNSAGFISAFAPQLDTNAVKGFNFGFTVTLMCLPFAALIGVLSSYLNSVARFSVSGISVLVFNLVICMYIVVFRFEPEPILGFSVAILLAVVLRLLFQAFFLQHRFWQGLLTSSPRTPDFPAKFAKGVVGYGIIIFIPILFRSIFAAQGDGNLALFNYAIRLFDLPAAILVAPIAVVILPFIAQQKENPTEVKNTTLIAILAVVTLTTTITIFGQFSGEVIVHTIYMRGAIQNENVEFIANLAKCFWIALPAYAVVVVGSAALNATDRQSHFMSGTFGALLLALGLFFAFKTSGSQFAAVWALVSFYNILAAIVLSQLYGLSLPSPATMFRLGFMIATICLLSVCYNSVAPAFAQSSLVIQIGLVFAFAGIALGANVHVFLAVRSLKEVNR